MRTVSLSLLALLVLVLAGPSCKKKEQPPPAPQGMAGQPGSPHGPMGGGPEKTIVVPEDVKAAWKAVKIEVNYKDKNATKQFDVPLHSDFRVPDTDLTVKVGAFLPHFSMSAEQITSNPATPENPACRVEIQEGGKEVFKGWLFARFPEVHPFEHGKVGVTLVSGVKK